MSRRAPAAAVGSYSASAEVMVAIGAPAWIGWPSAIGSSAIVPALCAVISFSIFIASMMVTSWPASTFCPASTSTFQTLPCSGDSNVSPDAPPPPPPPERSRRGFGAAAGATDVLVSPIQGTVLKVPVKKGDEVEEGTLICVVEAMKMENEITAHKAGKIAELPIAEGDSVTPGDTLAVITND